MNNSSNILKKIIKSLLTRKQYTFFTLAIAVIAAIAVVFSQPKDNYDQYAKDIADLKNTASITDQYAQETVSSTQAFDMVTVTRVIDGDTIEVSINGKTEKVRYIGINAPEVATNAKPAACFANEAFARNKALVEGKTVRLVKDVSETDKYGRLLRYVYIDNTFVNLALLQEGYAQVATYPPDVMHKDDFLLAQKGARDDKRGLWGDVCQK